MKSAAVIASAFVAVASADGQKGSPIGKVLQMIADLETKVISEGEEAQKVYDEFSEFCEERNKELTHELKTAKAQLEDLSATIDKETADIVTLSAKIEDLASQISKSEKELKEATSIRKGEADDFAVVDTQLTETIDTLKRAIGMIEREMQKGGSFAQLGSGAQNLMSALNVLVEASAIGSADAKRLTALVQAGSSSDEDDDAEEAPAAATYEGQSGGILEALEGLQDKAEEQLADARKEEQTSLNNFELKKQALTDELKFGNKDLDEAKKKSAACAERKSVAEGEKSAVEKEAKEDLKSTHALHKDCMAKASDFETETVTRGEELKALATAKKIIKEATGAAAASFLQMSSRSTLGGLPAVRIVRKLALAQQSNSLSRLAARMEAAIQNEAITGADPFEKVKGMVQSMLEKLQAEAEADATQKAFCDKELKEANAKKEEESTQVEKLTTKMDQNSAASTKLKEEVVELQRQLAEEAKAQKEMDKLRAEEKAIFDKNKAETEKGLDGLKLALKVLRDYYSANEDSGSTGAAGGIVSLLEVCESDFSKSLAELIAAEESSVAEYEATTKENEIAKAEKTQDVSYKTKEAASLDKANTEIATDLDGVQEQLDAVNEALASLEKQCVAKAETYEERVAKREKELAGLKDALSTLSEGSASLLQSGRRVSRVSKHLRA
eukprot:TRINITY_DN3054_c0_g3_i1.p1 TRINITY_DN3054_c0_g3~~TRINITY_DN3054_c0_g3_i1.p1  ORF type:complete len:674 (+),score=318.35 TRINITY_DN3054_c0_g3_i1:1315-3336(+)